MDEHEVDDSWLDVYDDRAASIYVDWAEFWARDRRESDWLVDDVLARGRAHSIYAAQKTGKSEFTLWLVLRAIERGDTVVAYFDWEMTEDDLYDRLEDFGYGPHSDLSRLRYALLPSLPPLDTSAGGRAILDHVDRLADEWPGEHIAVVIDTTSRAVCGEENNADTFRAFYGHTGLGLKQRGVTWARLDHAGKDGTKGQRGSSAKGDDVDVVWRLARTDDGCELIRDVTRMNWVPERVQFRRSVDPRLRYTRVAGAWPAGTKEVADLLDRLSVPLDTGERPAAKALRDAGHGRRSTVIRAAVKYRRAQAAEGQKWAS